MIPLDHPKRHLDRFSRFCAAHIRLSLYFTMGRHFPSKITVSPSGSGSHITVVPWAGTLGFPSQHSKRHLDRFSRFVGLTKVTNTQIHTQTYRPITTLLHMYSNRPLSLAIAAVRHNIIK